MSEAELETFFRETRAEVIVLAEAIDNLTSNTIQARQSRRRTPAGVAGTPGADRAYGPPAFVRTCMCDLLSRAPTQAIPMPSSRETSSSTSSSRPASPAAPTAAP